MDFNDFKQERFTLIRTFIDVQLVIPIKRLFVFVLLGFFAHKTYSQDNLLVNGGFEDINTCTEFAAECGVEGWFYLRDVKAQMLETEVNQKLFGSNSFGIFYTWQQYTSFMPVIGSIIPCGLQAGKNYTFKGMVSVKLNPNLEFMPGVCIDGKYFVPKRPFADTMVAHPIESVTKIPNTNFYAFEYHFTANGTERYITFGSFIQVTAQANRTVNGTQTISMVIDNFELLPDDKTEGRCEDYEANRKQIYAYNYRHKEMDHALYGRGDLNISFPGTHDHFITRKKIIPPAPKADTVRLGDVFFDFNRSQLKTNATAMLTKFFLEETTGMGIDSIKIEGHTDSIGGDEKNMLLSLRRCEAVKDWLVLNSVLATEFVAVTPFGRSRPVASNRTAEGRARNRRVEIIIFRKE